MPMYSSPMDAPLAESFSTPTRRQFANSRSQFFTRAFAALVACSAASFSSAQGTSGLCRYPDISKDSIVFVYGNDLWLVDKDGGVAQPIANPAGFEGSPRFSPDGKSIAFRGNYDSAADIYTLPIRGGVPQRVTHHPSAESLCDWTADGKSLILASSALEGLARAQKLYTVNATGGLPTQLPVPYGANGSLDRTGEWLAYTPHSTDTRTWKRYRGGMATDVLVYNIKTNESKRITDWEGTDTLPMWHGRRVYFLSDRSAKDTNVLNVFAYDLDSGNTEQITHFKGTDVKWSAIGPDTDGAGEMVFQWGDHIYRLDLATKQSVPVEITVPGDRDSLRATTVDAAKDMQGSSISPSGKRVAVVARGDIWSAPAENGTPRNLTRTDSIFERNAAWSPDGKTIAYFSDATGEYELYTMGADLKSADGKISASPEQPKQITKGGSAFRTAITWTPDSKSVVLQDKAGNIDLVKLEDGATTHLDRNPEGPRPVDISITHDSRWITWSRSCDQTELEAIYLFDTKEADATKALTQLTSGFFSDSEPMFDRKGDWIVFKSARNFAPKYGDFDTTWVYDSATVLLAVPLKKDFKLPWLPTSDEEGQKEDSKPAAASDATPAAGENARPSGPPAGGRRRRGDMTIAVDPSEFLAQDEKKDAPTQDAAPTAAGDWKGSCKIGEIEIAFTMTLTVAEDGTAKGSSSSEHGAADLSGTFDAATMTLRLTGKLNDQSFEIEATMDGESMTGNMFTTNAEGAREASPFTATRTAKSEKPTDGKGEGAKKESKKEVLIDLDGFEARALQLPAAAGAFGSIGFNDKNELLYGRDGSVRLLDLSEKTLAEKTGAAGSRFDVSADGKKLLLGGRGGASIAGASAGATPKPIVTAPMLSVVQPAHEWKEILTDAWRIMRDYFYDPGMHQVDWPAIRAKYEAMLPAVVTREDLNFLIAEMISELNVGHAYLQGGGDVEEVDNRTVGLLGATFAPATKEDGSPAAAWKLAKFFHGGAFDSDARSPLQAQGLGVTEGDFLLAVNGVAIDPNEDPWAPFVGLAGKSVVLTVSKKAVLDADAKDIVVTTIASEDNLHYRDWVESKRRMVEELSGGKIGYIYVPNTGTDGQTELVRQFFGQRTKPSLLIDDRWNGGGQIPTRFIELLDRPVTNFWARRDARDYAWPPDGHRGPMAMLINGLAGSGGDMFPWLFKANKLGSIIGTRTWGGLVGISGNPGLLDGGTISVPTFGFYESDGTWGVEGHGVDPDIEVLDDPALMVGGKDPQVEKAVEVLMQQLGEHPYKPTPKPTYPNRSGMGLPAADH
ncbi:MAG: hypothetical protein EXS10_01415 [Phycisphaerales bacterium]|nr:hypothetical protein [Phycisphaerales bacterium]